MQLYLVEAHDKLDAPTLDLLVACFPGLHIEVFENLLSLLSLPEDGAHRVAVVAEDLAHSGSPLATHCVAELRRRGMPVAIGRTADLLSLCAAMAGAAQATAKQPVATLRPADLHPAAASENAQAAGAHPLSERETEILLLLCDGLQNKQIARRLDLSVSTVKTHVANLFRKTGATNRLDAICKFNQSRAAERRAAPMPAPRRAAAWLEPQHLNWAA